MMAAGLESADFYANPYPTYATLRRQGEAVYDEERDLWFIGGYACAVDLLVNRKLRKDDRYERLTPEQTASPLLRMKSLWLLMRDGAFHRNGRAAVADGFSHRSIDSAEQLVREVCRDVIGAIEPGREFDLIAEVARPLPFQVISALLGVLGEESDALRVSSRALFATLEPGVTEEKWEAGERAAEHFTEVFSPRLRQPAVYGGALLRSIAETVDNGSTTFEAAVAMCSLMFIAGHETTTHFIGNAVNAIIEHRVDVGTFARRVWSEPRVLEEFWRYDSSVQNTLRIAEHEVELGEVTLPQGARCMILLGSANRDERFFDRPDTLDFTRPVRRHLGFGYGAHFCLGAPLARLEVSVVLSALASLGERWAVAQDEVTWTQSVTVRGPARFPMMLA